MEGDWAAGPDIYPQCFLGSGSWKTTTRVYVLGKRLIFQMDDSAKRPDPHIYALAGRKLRGASLRRVHPAVILAMKSAGLQTVIRNVHENFSLVWAALRVLDQHPVHR